MIAEISNDISRSMAIKEDSLLRCVIDRYFKGVALKDIKGRLSIEIRRGVKRVIADGMPVLDIHPIELAFDDPSKIDAKINYKWLDGYHEEK